MPSGQISHDTWLCKPCNLLFSSWEKLHEHKGMMRAAEKPKHIHCKFCSEDFKTERAEILHIQAKHPHAQNLECPACGAKPFTRLGGLMDHIDNKCTRLDGFALAEMRDQKLEFSKKLVALTKERVKKDYASYMPSAHGNGSTQLVMQDISRRSSEQAAPPRGRSIETKVLTGTYPHHQPDEKKPEAADRITPRPIFEALDTGHPDHPNFNTARHYSGLIEMYICSRVGCGKTFKNASGLVRHLRSATGHFGNIFRCPYCQRTFGSLTAVTMHIEFSTVRCQIRETDNYNAYMDQLTAGIVDVAHERYEDGTPKYKTSSSVLEAFGRGKAAALREDGRSKKENYWEGKEIHW